MNNILSEGPGIRPTILVIDDEPAIRRLLRSALEPAGYRVAEAGDANEGLDTITKKNPDLVILDLGLPDRDGLSVVETVRGWSQVPIIILSGRGQEEMKVKCFEAGVDDYVTKPFGVGELLARTKAALRRTLMSAPNADEAVFEHHHLKIDRSVRKVWVHGVEVHMTPTEYKLLCLLVMHAGKVVTHRQLLVEVWGNEFSEDSQYLRVYVGYLRKKIEPDSADAKLILTEPRIGYRFAI